MRRRRIMRLITLLLTIGLLASAGTATPVRAAKGSITLTVECYSNPERTTITNNTDETIDLGRTSLGQGYTLNSLHRPRPQPLRLFGIVAPGASITFETGPGASSNVLTRDKFYDDQAADEGASFGTPAFGGLKVLCSARTGTLAVATTPPTAGTPGATPPKLPNTGGGGTPPGSRPWSLGLTLLVVILLGGAYGYRRRA